MKNDLLCLGIMITSDVIIAILRTFEKLVFKPIMGRGFRLRGE